MTEIDLPATLTALSSLTVAAGLIVTAVLSFLSRRDAAAARKAAEASKAAVIVVDGKVFELAEQVDGRLTQLLAARDKEAVGAAALAEARGRAAGEQAQRDRHAESTS